MPADTIIELFIASFSETLFMVGVSGFIGALTGIPMGFVLYLASRRPNSVPAVRLTLRWCLNAVHCTPAIVVLAALLPVVHFFSAHDPGTTPSLVPLSVLAVAFIAQQTENALARVDQTLLDTARREEASTWQLVSGVLAPHASADIAAGLGLALSTLVGYSAIAGAIGGGGLGDLGIRYGYQRFIPELMLAVVVALVVLAEATHYLGRVAAARLSERWAST